MSPAQIQEPWDRYNRVPPRAGRTYPIGQTGIRDALTAAGARVVRLGLGGGWDGNPYGVSAPVPPHALLRAWWSADRQPGFIPHLDADGRRSGWTGLHLFAVASDQAGVARAVLAEGALADVVSWIAANPDRGEGWQASNHELVVLFQDGVVRRTER